MKIVDIKVTRFRKDSWVGIDIDGHMHPSIKSNSTASLVQVFTDEGITGMYLTADNYLVPSDKYDEKAITDLCGGNYVAAGTGDSLKDSINKLKPILIGEDPLARERIFKKVSRMQRLGGSVPIMDEIVGIIDCCLWDLIGNKVGLPIYKLLGGHRTRIPAYGSIMVGDDYKGGLDTPDSYARYAIELKKRG